MEIQKCSGIVLGSRPAGEADRTVRVYTREYGKRTFVFKGIRKSRKRSIAATEPGTVLDLVYYFHDGRDSSIVNEFTITRQHRGQGGDLRRILYLFLILEVVDRTTGQNDPNRAVYELLAAALAALDDTPGPGHLAAFFILHLIRIDGILPDFSACRACGRRDFTDFVLDYSDLSPLCGACAGSRGMGRTLPRGAMDFIRASMRTRFPKMELGTFGEGMVLDVLFSLCLFIEGYFHVLIKSKEMVFSGIADGKNA
jgi:DNA repair protein RecO